MKRRTVILATVLICFLLISPYQVLGNEKGNFRIYVDLWTNQLFVIKKEKVIRKFNIAPGNENSPTPIGIFEVTDKSKSWGGGFGTRWLGLNVPWGKFGIHGTNRPELIGRNVSSGCVRMRNKDVEQLYEMVPVGTKVEIAGPILGEGKGELKSLSVGSKGNLVQLVQQRLKAAGYYHGNADGVFGNGTKQAVKKYQKENNLPQTGSITSVEYRELGLLE
ncbi:L,D-transpeptidase family protein [Pseudalkalibacillus caeni]|uniref:L,D-TPase catalytic domain-containing protein n=1 Tax=Exobacillus caeni TaxID=2574798 RepID=A0A5R9EZ96_9BACL|nr:L,D-transpeptidase family protein [Pseudalkalibacillus caeni]TLS36161.1 hypothetical protein FCL54_16115 [Pseudalkalibacillus caeni]